jgi:hypothetical protein
MGWDDVDVSIARAERDGTRAETRIRLSPKRTSPFKSVRASVQSTTGSRGVRTSSSNGSNAGQTTFRGKVEWYWLPTPFACFPVTAPPVCHQVPNELYNKSGSWHTITVVAPCPLSEKLSSPSWSVIQSIGSFGMGKPSWVTGRSVEGKFRYWTTCLDLAEKYFTLVKQK